MQQLELTPYFDGATYQPEHDHERLATQLERVNLLMRDGRWRTLREIATLVSGSEAGVSARLRDLRKSRFGGHIIVRERISGGLWHYKLLQ